MTFLLQEISPNKISLLILMQRQRLHFSCSIHTLNCIFVVFHLQLECFIVYNFSAIIERVLYPNIHADLKLWIFVCLIETNIFTKFCLWKSKITFFHFHPIKYQPLVATARRDVKFLFSLHSYG